MKKIASISLMTLLCFGLLTGCNRNTSSSSSMVSEKSPVSDVVSGGKDVVSDVVSGGKDVVSDVVSGTKETASDIASR